MYQANWLTRILSTVSSWWQLRDIPPSLPIYPSDILVKETYNYSAQLSSVVQKQIDHWTGSFDIIVADDEWRKVPLHAKVEDSFIIIDHYDRTNLDAQINRYHLNDEHFPLQQIIRRAYSDHSSIRNNCQFAHRIRVPYEPEEPWEPVLKIYIQIYDQTKVEDQNAVQGERQRFNWYQTANNQDDFSSKQIMEQVINQVGFENALIFEFSLQLFVPKHVHMPEQTVPVLKSMSLKWPVRTSHNQIRLQVNDNLQTISFDPVTQSITWQSVKFYVDPSVDDHQYQMFWTPPMTLMVNEPIELYREAISDNDTHINIKQIPGELEIELPCLLSGLKITFSKKYSYASKAINLTTSTAIRTSFELFVEECFARRAYSPYQHLQFPHVVLSPMRLADIVLLLKDMRFRVQKEDKPEKVKLLGIDGREVQRERFLIRAKRQEGGKEMNLWIVVEGTPSETTREKEIPGNEKYKTSLDTGSMVMYIRGQINEDPHRVVENINLIHEQLKERFRHVSTIE